MAEDIKCPYCSSKDLSKIQPSSGTSTTPTSVTYKCQMCQRTFSKTAPEAE